MPELPEVETVRRGLIPALEGQRIITAEINRPDLRWPFPDRMAARLEGTQVLALRRRAKVLLLDLDSGETLLSHLGMSGSYRVRPADNHPPEKHDHVRLTTQNRQFITYHDPRRFGAMDLHPTSKLLTHSWLKDLGPEPFAPDLCIADLAARICPRKAPIKSLLLNAKIIAGLGNIYVCESLFRAKIHPARPGESLNETEITALYHAIVQVIADAIAAGGATLQDHRQPSGETGYFQHHFDVYGKAGTPCPVCCHHNRPHSTIVRIVQAGRSSFFCPICQPLP
jgi:formamidopyrimidine-DNA glycosylase